jgi:hypothetical protein
MKWRVTVFAILASALLWAGVLQRGGGENDCCDVRAEELYPAWVAGLRALDEAVGTGDFGAASRVWPAAWATAFASRRWDVLLATGDAALRMSALENSPVSARANARRAYRAALFRARAQASVEGVLRACEAMKVLGDRDMAEAAVHMARKLASDTNDAELRGRVERDLARIAHRVPDVVPVNASGEASTVP